MKLCVKSVSVRTLLPYNLSCAGTQAQVLKQDVCQNTPLNVSIEAQSSFGWERYTGNNGLQFSVDRFGASGNQADIAENFGFTAEHIVSRIKASSKVVQVAQ